MLTVLPRVFYNSDIYIYISYTHPTERYRKIVSNKIYLDLPLRLLRSNNNKLRLLFLYIRKLRILTFNIHPFPRNPISLQKILATHLKLTSLKRTISRHRSISIVIDRENKSERCKKWKTRIMDGEIDLVFRSICKMYTCKEQSRILLRILPPSRYSPKI